MTILPLDGIVRPKASSAGSFRLCNGRSVPEVVLEYREDDPVIRIEVACTTAAVPTRTTVPASTDSRFVSVFGLHMRASYTWALTRSTGKSIFFRTQDVPRELSAQTQNPGLPEEPSHRLPCLCATFGLYACFHALDTRGRCRCGPRGLPRSR